MKIYFAFSIRGEKANRLNLKILADVMRRHGQILTEAGTKELLVDAAIRGLSDREVYLRDINWLAEADAIVAEVSAPSLGVGYEIARGELLGKPVLCLCQENKRRLSAMIAGNANIRVERYKRAKEAARYLEEFLNEVNQKRVGALGRFSESVFSPD